MSGLFSNLSRTLRVSTAGVALLVASGCADGQMPAFLKSRDGGDGEVVSRASTTEARGVARDVEAPEVFQAKEAGLWDGRPSLGGVWVAHPDVKEPERVIIRNQQNGKFVIGALFRKERETPGPRLQVSSDAAAALGVLAGQPSNLDVVALRREEAAEPELTDPANDPLALGSGPDTGPVPAAPDVISGTLDPVIGGATAAIATAAVTPTKPKAAAKPVAKPAAASGAPAPSSKLGKPYIQIGIFSVEANAKNTATAMRQSGMVPTVKTHNSNGKTFWRVVVGPAQTKEEMATLLKTIKGSGFKDAYAVTD